MNTQNENDRPVGVFDSGVGGLTVHKAIRAELPQENIVYLGDTARLPYGTKSPTSVARYAIRAAAQLQAQDIKLLVVACNTASAVALEQLRDQLSPLPVIGVVEPGAEAATSARPHAAHLVLATEATVRLGAYRQAISARDPDASIREHACELLVSLAEEGWNDGDIALAIIRRYLDEATVGGFVADTIILGCTHFPLLRASIRAVADDNVVLIDSASTTAGVVRETLAAAGQLRDHEEHGATRFLATDGARRFASVGSRFLGRELTCDDVELVDL